MGPPRTSIPMVPPKWHVHPSPDPPLTPRCNYTSHQGYHPPIPLPDAEPLLLLVSQPIPGGQTSMTGGRGRAVRGPPRCSPRPGSPPSSQRGSPHSCPSALQDHRAHPPCTLPPSLAHSVPPLERGARGPSPSSPAPPSNPAALGGPPGRESLPGGGEQGSGGGRHAWQATTQITDGQGWRRRPHTSPDPQCLITERSKGAWMS